MSRVHWFAPAALPAALAGLMLAGLLAAPAEAAALHKAKPLKTLPTLKAAVKQASTPGLVSPYARAASQRNESGRLPPGHPYVPPRSATNPAGLAQ
jgi:hypothetical protein